MSQRVVVIGIHFEVVAGIRTGLAAYARQFTPWHVEINPFETPLDRTWLAQQELLGVVGANMAWDDMKDFVDARQKVVSVVSDLTEHGVSSVLPDEEAIGAMAADHFWECGYRHMAFFGLQGDWSQRRYQGFVRRLKEHGIRTCLTNQQVYGSGDKARWAEWMELFDAKLVGAWLKRIPRPGAVLVCCDYLARVVTETATELGLRVPEDLAILGVDNSDTFCEVNALTLSSVDINMEQLGYMAGQMLDRMLQGEKSPRRLRVQPSHVVQRISTNPAAHHDPDVAEAMRFLQNNAGREVSIAALCQRLAISRRRLEQKFAQCVGRSPGQELRLLRMRRGQELLRITNLPLTDIAKRCGYRHLSSFCAAFRAVVGVTPDQFRKNDSMRKWKADGGEDE